MADEFLQGAQIGLGMAQHWAAQSARQQQLRIEDSYRRMQERKMAADVEQAAEHTRLLHHQIIQGIAKDAAFKQAQADMAADMELNGTPPDQSFMRNVVPVMVQFDPKNAGTAVMDALRFPLVQEANKQLAEQRKASARFSNARADEQELENENLAWLGPGNAGTGATKPTAFDTNSRLYKEAQLAVIEADNARQDAETPEERAAAESAYQEALIDFKSKERFAPAGGSEFNKQAAQTRLDQSNRRLDNASIKLEKDMAESGFKVEHNPDGTKTLTPTARPPTTATVTENQQKVKADEIATKTLAEAMDFVRTRPEAFGPQGKALAAAEKARSMRSGGKTPMPVTEARQAATRNFITIADSIRVDSGNMNQKELELLKDAGDITGWLDDPGSSARKLDGLMRLKITQLKKRYDVLRTEPPADLITSLPDRALAYAVHEGLLTKDKAEAEFNRRRKK